MRMSSFPFARDSTWDLQEAMDSGFVTSRGRSSMPSFERGSRVSVRRAVAKTL